MPREMHRSASEAQSSNGSIWRKDEARPGGLEVGSRKEKGLRRQTEGSRSGSTSAQAMQDAGSGVVAGLNDARDPNSIESLGRVLNSEANHDANSKAKSEEQQTAKASRSDHGWGRKQSGRRRGERLPEEGASDSMKGCDCPQRTARKGQSSPHS